MRRAVFYRITRLRGFFWGRRLFLYKRRTAGWLAPVGLGLQPRRWLWALVDGLMIKRGFRPTKRRRLLPPARLRNAGRVQLRLLTPRIEPVWPAAWNIARYLYTRHWRGRRFRLGLPAHGQRTHSNAKTTRRFKSPVTAYVREALWWRRLWVAAPKPKQPSRPRVKLQSRRAAKAIRHRRGVIRTKKLKKKDIWR